MAGGGPGDGAAADGFTHLQGEGGQGWHGGQCSVDRGWV
jgi:hypothetical protein